MPTIDDGTPSDDNNNFDRELRELLLGEVDRFIRDNDADAKANESKTNLDERIERFAATLPPEKAEDLLTGWPYFKTDASDAELENVARSLDRDFPEGNNATREGKATKRMLRLAAKMKTLDPQEAEKLLQSWRYLQMHHSEAELDVMYPSPSRAERRERVRQELERLHSLGDGDSEGQSSSDSA